MATKTFKIEGAKLSLDHLKCDVNGGGNESKNLVTSCSRCNSSRGARSIAEFARAVAAYINHGATAEAIIARVRAAARRKVRLEEARAMLARRKNLTGCMVEILQQQQ